ncbi:uncharacterized protein PV09_06198 [Verruconis gallopava]|uniref:Zn(2)-C6 fungal-type domain-containing protein n=1 Tax=Verruconis gallopava TaxID=253628 RepID=A0A0D1XJA2_9PEZI|nr:uncharacterized protein PV09_06198 [Verruconis gallopava]KIW02376.1 hypothetical protein PV09_06198 [Verruconis gallopava]
MATSVAVHSQQGFQTLEHQQPHPTSQLPSVTTHGNPVWQNPNPPLPRGRAPRDPQAVTTKLQCSTLADMEAKLRDYLNNPPAPPEHCTCELTLWAGASFLVKLDYVPPNLRGNQQPQDMGMLQAVADFNDPRPQAGTTEGRETALSVLDALQELSDPKETMKRQRAISKVCVAAVQKTDGYRYSFHNSWRSGEDNAYRFSYYCNDSLLNKDRVANGKSGSQGKRATKPVYDCKGVLSIKFSATRQCIDVVYRHIPCHETYEDRAPPPRKNSKRRAEWEAKNPDRVKAPKRESSGASEQAREPPQKKKKKNDVNEPAKSTEAELREQSMISLLELMRPEEKKVEAPAAQTPTASSSMQNAPVAPAAAQKTPSRRQPKSAVQCAICVSRRTKCDGAKPKCRPCAEKNWPCFYQPEQASSSIAAKGSHTSPQIQSNSVPTFDTMQQGELTALTLASQNEDLQKEIASVRQDQLTAQKEAYELKAQLAEMRKQIESLKAENNRLNTPQPQPIQQPPPLQQQSTMNSSMNLGHERSRSTQHHHIPSTPQQPSYSPYQPNTHQMYHHSQQNQAAHSRAHGQPVYQTNDNRPQPQNAWNQGLYGPYQQQHSMLPSAHNMMSGYR